MAENKELVVKRTLVVTSRAPFDEDHFGKMTLEQAVESVHLTGEAFWEEVQACVALGYIDSEETSVEVVDKDTGESRVHPTKSETVGEHTRRISGARDDGQYGQ